MNYPKISIVTTSFNQGQYLEQTILSVISQGYPNLEYIIIDGGSTDNSLDIIKKYETHLTYWVSENDNGMYEAIQKGFEKCTGEIMTWINSDDVFHQNALFVVSEIFSRFQGVEWLEGLPSIIDEKGRIVMVHNFRRWTKYDFLQGDYEFIQQEGCFWRRSLWERAGGKLNTELRYAGDFALWLNFFTYAELYCITTVLGGFRVRAKNQFSLERRTEYRDEAIKLLKIRQHNLLPGERKNLNRISFYRNFISKIPVFKKIFNIIYIERMYPPIIFFDITSQQFITKEQVHRNFNSLLKSYLKRMFKKNTGIFLLSCCIIFSMSILY